MNLSLSRDRHRARRLLNAGIVLLVLLLALLLGFEARPQVWVGLLVGLGGLVVLLQPALGLLLVPPVAMFVDVEVGTGTAVPLNPVTLALPLLVAVWAVVALRRRELHLRLRGPSLPLALLLLALLFSLLIGRALWDPLVPLPGNFLLVQFAQWGIFALSAAAYWLTANLLPGERWLKWLTLPFLVLTTLVSAGLLVPLTGDFLFDVGTEALYRAPLWILVCGLAGGQLLFNRDLAPPLKVVCLAALGLVTYSAFVVNRESASGWVGVGVVLAMLVWLRWPRLRWPALLLVVGLAVSGVLFSGLYEFAGGEVEWFRTGGSRLALTTRVLEDTWRNPVTGLGPAAYRIYGVTRPLRYQHILWFNPGISSHNNYVDIFSHGGLVALGLFSWFLFEITRLGLRLRAHYRVSFASGYVNGILATGAGALVLMLLADWILPFVYNISFQGFQASVLVWLFLGGLPALARFATPARQPDP